jgi:hypothetical protein
MTSRCAGEERERKDTVERERESFFAVEDKGEGGAGEEKVEKEK